MKRYRRWTEAARAHAPTVLLCAPFLALAFLPVDRLPGPWCLFHEWTGMPCPFCGSIRAFRYIAHGQWLHALRMNPFAAALFVALMAGTIAGLTGLLFRLQYPSLPRKQRNISLLAAGLCLAASWLYVLISGCV